MKPVVVMRQYTGKGADIGLRWRAGGGATFMRLRARSCRGTADRGDDLLSV
jgi:hypothetical protein